MFLFFFFLHLHNQVGKDWHLKTYSRCYQWGSFIFCCNDGNFYVVNTFVFPSGNVPILSDFLALCLMVFVPKMHWYFCFVVRTLWFWTCGAVEERWFLMVTTWRSLIISNLHSAILNKMLLEIFQIIAWTEYLIMGIFFKKEKAAHHLSVRIHVMIGILKKGC